MRDYPNPFRAGVVAKALVALTAFIAVAATALPASAQTAQQFLVGTWTENWTAPIQGRAYSNSTTQQFFSNGAFSGSGTISNDSRTVSYSVQGTYSAQMRSDGRIDLVIYCTSGDCGGVPSRGSTFEIVDNNTIRNPTLPAQVMRRAQ